MSTVIQVRELSKAYQLGQFSSGTLSRDIDRWWKLLRGKEDPLLKIGEENDRAHSGKSDVVWSLKGINFDIKAGDAVGIVGKNGAGKSTLLKILSQITSPTTGDIKIKGRIASLLEVGTGFHPELSGRENIFLNGAILGMKKKEIQKKFDAIVDFAGVERYIDTPVKRYSSGMYVRLAFAVAAHLESEILIIDEVLAVGDAEFQKKCLSKMGDISRGEGRTVLFVSHNMSAVSSLCNSGILLKNGKLSAQSNNIEEIIQEYSLQNIQNSSIQKTWTGHNRPGNDVFRINSISLIDEEHKIQAQPVVGRKFGISVQYEIMKQGVRGCPLIVVSDHTGYNGNDLFISMVPSSKIVYSAGVVTAICWFPPDLFNNKTYFIKVDITEFGSPLYCHASVANEISFEVIEAAVSERIVDYKDTYFHGALRPQLEWDVIKDSR